VRWIDSKAMFGDAQTWASEHLPQLEGYVHRFGPGLVLYWFGFERDGLDSCEDIGVCSELPGEFLFPGDSEPTAHHMSALT